MITSQKSPTTHQNIIVFGHHKNDMLYQIVAPNDEGFVISRCGSVGIFLDDWFVILEPKIVRVRARCYKYVEWQGTVTITNG